MPNSIKHFLMKAVTTPAMLCSASLLFAHEMPQEDGKTIGEIAAILEEAGYMPVTEISYDDHYWEAEAYKNGEKRDLKLDPTSGKIISDKKDY